MPPRPRIPPSQRVADDLRSRLQAGEWPRDAQLPSVSDLSVYYSTSRPTVLKALRVLADEGLISVKPQWGTFSNCGSEGAEV